MTEDTRYPYTYAADFLRSVAGYNAQGTNLSRSDASQIRSKIAEIIGMDDEELAKKLADYYLANQEEMTEKSVDEFLTSSGLKKD
jgi:hypothetical protein